MLMFGPLSPFKYGNNIPTNEEVSRVSEDILHDFTIIIGHDSRERDEVRRILEGLVSPTPSGPVSDLAFVEYTHPEDFVVAEILYNGGARPHQLILTREERRRVFRIDPGLPGSIVPEPFQHLTGRADDDVDMVSDFGDGDSVFRELEFNSQIPQYDFDEPDHPRPEDGEEGCLPTPAKRRRLGEFSPVVDSDFEPPLVSPDSDGVHCVVLPPMKGVTPPGRAEIPTERHFPQITPGPQKAHVLPDIALRLRDSILPNIPDISHHVIPPATGRTTEPGPARHIRRRQDFSRFLALRGVCLSPPPVVAATDTATNNPQHLEALQVPTQVPPDLIDKNTIQLPAVGSLPVSRHQYLASLDLLQKHALCRCLSDDTAAIDLVEREFLGGVDLILDPDTAILFLPLSVVPSECEGLIAGISDISWRYPYILVIFEVFLISQAFCDGEENRAVSFTLTEPILKSVKKLKRSLAIAEGVGTKTEDCLISWAFARNIEEAAKLARVYGDMAESRDRTGGSLWQERWWLWERETEGSPLFEPEVCPVRMF